MKLNNLDMSDLPEVYGGDYKTLPDGRYILTYDDAETKVSAKDNEYVSITFSVCSPEQFSGRKIWKNLNLFHPNETAANIAKAELRSIFEAAGLEIPSGEDVDIDTDELINCEICALIEANAKGYAEIKSFEKVDANAATHVAERSAKTEKKKTQTRRQSSSLDDESDIPW